jgi:hypothetical protein
LKPKRLARLTWEELDHLQAGADVAMQKSLVGARIVAVQVANMLAEKHLKPTEYFYLPAVDGPPAEAKPLNTEWLERMKAKHGNKLELA